MTLPQNPKIGDIITELQDLTLINQKAELAGVIGSPTTATSNNQEFVETIQDAKDIISEKTGLDSLLPLLDLANGINVGNGYITVEYAATETGLKTVATNLPFVPRVAIAINNSVSHYSYGFKLVWKNDVVITGGVARASSNYTSFSPTLTREQVRLNLPTTSNFVVHIFE